jgi:hypothetical protein
MSGAIAYVIMLGGAIGTAIGLYYTLRAVKLI